MLNSEANVVLVAVSQFQSASDEGECLRCRIRVNTVVVPFALMADIWSVVAITALTVTSPNDSFIYFSFASMYPVKQCLKW